MVVVHEVELREPGLRDDASHHHHHHHPPPPPPPPPPGARHPYHHHGTLPKALAASGVGSLPRSDRPTAPYQMEDEDDLPDYAEAGPPGPPPLALIDRHPYLCPGSSRSTTDFCDTSSSSPLEKRDRFTALSALFALVSLVSYTVDVGSDAVVCYFLYLEGNLWWFGLTLAVTVIPAVTVNAFSLRWYMHDDRESRSKDASGSTLLRPKMSPLDWTLRVLFHLMFLGPVIRYIDLLVYGLKSRSREKRNRQRQQQWHLTPVRLEQPRSQQVDYYLLMIHEDRDTALLALLESFMQSAPQLVLQLYILAERFDRQVASVESLTVLAQLASVGTSLFELSWSLASYHRALRRSVPDKQNMTRVGSALQFLWRLSTVGARVLSLALFASEYHYWLFPVCIGHWGVMTVWVMHQGTRFCDTESGQPRPCEEYLFNMVIGAIYLFCFLNVKDEPTRYKYTAYYVIVFLENAALIVLWYFRVDPTLWYRLPALVAVLASFGCGIVIMLTYYRFFHPNGRLPLYNPIARCC